MLTTLPAFWIGLNKWIDWPFDWLLNADFKMSKNSEMF